MTATRFLPFFFSLPAWSARTSSAATVSHTRTGLDRAPDGVPVKAPPLVADWRLDDDGHLVCHWTTQ
jgi:hypothetical protein